MPFIRFSSHRARSYGLRALDRHPQAYFSFHRKTGPGGVYEVTAEEIARMKARLGHARFTVLRAPYSDLIQCWPESDWGVCN